LLLGVVALPSGGADGSGYQPPSRYLESLPASTGAVERRQLRCYLIASRLELLSLLKVPRMKERINQNTGPRRSGTPRPKRLGALPAAQSEPCSVTMLT
jgi:hypothetical protein